MIFRFDHYTLNSETRTLSCHDTIVTLTPKVFQTLLVLVENHHRVMSKADLFDHLWPHQAVEEANLTQNISILRKTLEETTHGKRYIATFHGRGYRFVEPVVVECDPCNLVIDESHADQESSRSADATEGEPVLAPYRDIANRTEMAAIRRDSNNRYARFLLTAMSIFLSVAAIALLCLRGHANLQPIDAQPLEVTTLTRMEGSQYQPSWSQGGKKLAFVDAPPSQGDSAIYIQVAQEARPRQLISASGLVSSPVWSPDEKSLAFIRTTQNTAGIFVFSLQDQITRKLTTLFPHRYGLDYRRLDWSPDGGFLVVNDKINESDPFSLYLVHVSDGKKLRLTYPNMDIIGDVAPRFSPDGTQVAFIRVKYQFQDGVFILPVTGGEAQQLTDQSHLLSDVDWQTNDNLIFSGRLDNEFRFWRRDVRIPNALATLVSPIGTDLPTQFSIFRRSGQIAFSAYGPDLNIWSLDLTKEPSASTAWTSIISTPGQDLGPSLSPDGLKMAFRSDHAGQVQLWVSNRDGTGTSLIDTRGMSPSVYCWERDSRRIIFSPQFEPGLFEVSLSPTPTLRHITDLPLSHPACSIDGKSVFAINRNFVYRISILDGTAEKITDDGGAPIVQTADGRYLYFAHGRMDSTITRLELPTGKQTIIVNTLAEGYSESWALTAKGILFLKMASDGPVIALHDSVTGKETAVTKFIGSLPPVGMSQFSISPDERFLFVVRADPVFSNIQSVDLAPVEKHLSRAN